MENKTTQTTLVQAAKNYRATTEKYIDIANEYMSETAKLDQINNEMIEYLGNMVVEAIALLKKNGIEVPQTMIADLDAIKARVGV